MGEVAGLVAANDRSKTDGKWRVRFGTSQYPDYAHPRYGEGYTSGHMLDADEAEALAEHLTRCAAWARAQNGLDRIEAV